MNISFIFKRKLLLELLLELGSTSKALFSSDGGFTSSFRYSFYYVVIKAPRLILSLELIVTTTTEEMERCK